MSAKPIKAKRSKLAPKRKVARLKLRPGQPDAKSKLDDEIEQKICNLVAAGQSRETAAMMCGIQRETIRQWRIKGQEDPDSRYGQFLRAIDLADETAIAMMVNRLLKDPDSKWTWKILKNKRPEEFNERLHIRSELSGPDGAPIPVDLGRKFTVNVNCPGLDEPFLRKLMPVRNSDGSPVPDAENPHKLRESARAAAEKNGENGQ